MFYCEKRSKTGMRSIPYTICYIYIYTDIILKRLEESGVGFHMDGHFTGALAYANDITLLSPSVSGLRTLSKVSEEYATEFDVTFKGKKVSCCFFRS